MPDFWNTIGNLKFYNFISNQYFNGIAPANSSSFTQSFLIRDWLSNYVFSANPSLFSASAIHLYFPKVIGSPTENESCTGNPNATNNYRFRLFLNQDYSLYYNSTSNSDSIITSNSGTAASSFGVSNIIRDLNISAASFDFCFTFGVASPTTIALFEFLLPNQPRKALINYTLSNFLIFGWAHNSIFPSPFTEANARYNSCYILNGRNNYGTNFPSLIGRRPTITGTTSSQDIGEIKYYDIECLSGSYNPGIFFTDLILRDNNNTLGYPMVGKVDNRVACIARGNCISGEVYRATNIFGRTGVEDWVCVSPFMPSTNTINSWTPTTTFRNDYYKAWKLNEYDYLMIRVATYND